ncbi:uncharacterized protein LOC127374168 [Dicentrarchus labrax]|uniref:uncharacterized protein LOC127374168 n=1 Tax=Dicentrarchus labrax TaxID=13489 RepID=UPI0021F603CB|nr:uncharacterized protein LOC127374168 [Dicentrarchus labrax]
MAFCACSEADSTNSTVAVCKLAGECVLGQDLTLLSSNDISLSDRAPGSKRVSEWATKSEGAPSGPVRTDCADHSELSQHLQRNIALCVFHTFVSLRTGQSAFVCGSSVVVEAEFTRITTVPLRSKFMQQLDHHSTRLITIFKRKGGAAGRKIRTIMADLDKNDAVETRRACVLKALMVYLNEDPENLIREYMDVEDNQEAMDQTVLGIFAIKMEGAESTDGLADVGIIIEGVEVLHDLDNTANAVAILFGLMYSLDLSYPTNLKYTFEVLQKLVMELDGNKLSTKAQVLKNKLFEGTF